MNDPILILAIVGGHYMCRCGNTLYVGPKLFGCFKKTRLLEGIYHVYEIELPDELKTEEERGQ